MYSVLFINSTVDNTSGPALHFPPLKGHGETSLTEDGVEFKQLDEGPVRDKRGRLGMLGLWLWHGAVG